MREINKQQATEQQNGGKNSESRSPLPVFAAPKTSIAGVRH
jgi:hypothetical protein